MDKVAAIIPCMNLSHMTNDLLQSLYYTDEPTLWQVVVVDNGSIDNTQEVLGNWQELFRGNIGAELTIIKNADNRGFGPAVNQGIRNCFDSTTHYCIFNNDQLVRENWLYWLLRAIDEYPRLGMATSELIHSDGMSKKCYEETNFLYTHLFCKLRVDLYLKGSPWLVPRYIVEQIGMIDEEYKMGQYEDCDWMVRMFNAGYYFGQVSNSPTYHYNNSPTQSQMPYAARQAYSTVNRARFDQKWGDFHSYFDAGGHFYRRLPGEAFDVRK